MQEAPRKSEATESSTNASGRHANTATGSDDNTSNEDASNTSCLLRRLLCEDCFSLVLAELTPEVAATMCQVDRFFFFRRSEWAVNPAKALVARGDAHEKKKQWKEAAHFFKIANEISPESSALLKQAEVQGRLHGVEVDVTRRIVNRAITLDETCEAKAHDIIGKVLVVSISQLEAS